MKLKTAKLTNIFLAFVSVAISIVSASGQGIEDLTEEAKKLDTGMGKVLFVYVTTPSAPLEDVLKMLPDHMDFVHDIEREGAMVMGGQTLVEGEEEASGSGVIVIRANSFEEAKRIADRDPMHKTGVRSYRLYKWMINEGTMNLRLQFSNQKFEIN